MSFERYKKFIENGDTVILFLGFDNMLQFTVDANRTHQTRYGALRHKDLIGVEYGSKVQCSKGYAHVLYPTPELWTQNLPHRTQILYSTDISLITLQLDLKPGSIVVESGTGSASLSHALLRTVVPGGHLHTFDFHEQRAKKARDEFAEHGFGDDCTVKHKDVLSDGFDLEDVADAVFLDLPAPWDALPHAKKALKRIGGRICSFSPCIEQVQRACDKLQELGFFEIETMECLSRNFDVRTVNMPMPDLGFAWETSSSVQQSEGDDRGGSYHHPVIGGVELATPDGEKKKNRGRQQSQKKNKMLKKNVKDNVGQSCEGESEENTDKAEANPKQEQHNSKKDYFDKNTSFVFKSGVPPQQMHGHTGYLTFATLLPQ